ncbi:Uma2 family endonuclease [Gloeobacter morelensis]|uniref:Uma2 family endonuclease n=1 Tax=Gloeobacter morelensis MG652769 TaxID=2781736 RepID=A0ABY3PIZ3_9CYAN|nr:Uma2 family endonuclease [Gloeobacter morelensis]UFP93637.1 Uma2 family endonuclease [Gloeobacter morelensis MG652769]
MTVTLQLEQLSIFPGQRIVLRDVSWQQFEAILKELGDRRASRLVYDDGILEIRMPLPEHERSKILLSDLVKNLLEALDIDFEPFGSSTFKRMDMAKGIEPDECFYIQNHAAMIGKRRIDLTSDPPPDLAIEVDVTSKTQLEVYRALGVPELWRYEAGRLRIDILQSGWYVESPISPTFPDLPLVEILPGFVKMAATAGTRPALKAFRQWVKEHLQK